MRVRPRPIPKIRRLGLQVSTQPAFGSTMPVKCGKSAYKNAGLDKLATDLSKRVKVYRVQESIVIPLANRSFFGEDSNALTRDGKRFISEIAGDLSCYPDTSVYIQESSDSSTASKYQAEDQAFMIQTALRDDGVDINRLEIDLTTPSRLSKSGKHGNKGVLSERFFELRIVPRT